VALDDDDDSERSAVIAALDAMAAAPSGCVWCCHRCALTRAHCVCSVGRDAARIAQRMRTDF
jgi:hypothetical protein